MNGVLDLKCFATLESSDFRVAVSRQLGLELIDMIPIPGMLIPASTVRKTIIVGFGLVLRAGVSCLLLLLLTAITMMIKSSFARQVLVVWWLWLQAVGIGPTSRENCVLETLNSPTNRGASARSSAGESRRTSCPVAQRYVEVEMGKFRFLGALGLGRRRHGLWGFGVFGLRV